MRPGYEAIGSMLYVRHTKRTLPMVQSPSLRYCCRLQHRCRLPPNRNSVSSHLADRPSPIQPAHIPYEDACPMSYSQHRVTLCAVHNPPLLYKVVFRGTNIVRDIRILMSTRSSSSSSPRILLFLLLTAADTCLHIGQDQTKANCGSQFICGKNMMQCADKYDKEHIPFEVPNKLKPYCLCSFTLNAKRTVNSSSLVVSCTGWKEMVRRSKLTSIYDFFFHSRW